MMHKTCLRFGLSKTFWQTGRCSKYPANNQMVSLTFFIDVKVLLNRNSRFLARTIFLSQVELWFFLSLYLKLFKLFRCWHNFPHHALAQKVL